MPYISVSDAAGFTDFCTTVFSATQTHISMREGGKSIMHGQLRISGSTIMYCDATEHWKPQPAHLFIYMPDADETYHSALEHGATSLMQPADRSYGRSCGVTDPYGNVWWITSAPAS